MLSCVQKCCSYGPRQALTLCCCCCCRIYYSFDQLRLRLLGLQLPLPVVFKGGGWTDCVLLLDDDKLRVMENSRRDTLVLERVL